MAVLTGMKIYIDGKYYSERDAKISVFDHGLLYGDGVFEGIRAYHGRDFKIKEHIDRLVCSAKAILLALPISHKGIMVVVAEGCRSAQLRARYVRLGVMGGVGPFGSNRNHCQ